MTATQLQFRRGSAAQMATFTGAPGEVVVDTSNNRVVVHDGTTAGGWPAARIAEVAPQCGRLSWVTNNQIKFAPFNGGSIKIAGLLYAIPSGGITAANASVYVNGTAGQNLAPSTPYYVYVFNNAGTLTIDFSTTGHATDTATGNVGVEIKSGDNSRTLIGMVYTNASAQFVDSASSRTVASWFNRQPRALLGAMTTNNTTSSTSAWVEINTAARTGFLTWSDAPVIYLSGIGGASQTTNAGQTIYLNIGIDNTNPIAISGSISPPTINVGWTIFTEVMSAAAEGYHYATPLGLVLAGTGAYTVQISGLIFT